MVLKIQKKNKKQLTKKKSNKKSNKRNRKKSFKKKLHLKVKGGGPNYSLVTGENKNYEITYFGQTGNPDSLTCKDVNVNKKLQEVMCENLTKLLGEIEVTEPIFKKRAMSNELLFEKEHMLTVKKIAFVLIVFAIYSKIGPFFTTFNQRNNIKVYFELYSGDGSEVENPEIILINKIKPLVQKKNITKEDIDSFFLDDNSVNKAIIDIKFNKKNSYDLTGSHFPSFLKNCMDYSNVNGIFQIIKIIMEQNFTELYELYELNITRIDGDLDKKRKTYLTALLDNIFVIVEKQLLVVDEKEFMKIIMQEKLKSGLALINQGTRNSNTLTTVNTGESKPATKTKPKTMFSYLNYHPNNDPKNELENTVKAASETYTNAKKKITK